MCVCVGGAAAQASVGRVWGGVEGGSGVCVAALPPIPHPLTHTLRLRREGGQAGRQVGKREGGQAGRKEGRQTGRPVV